jgi:hypothetical protein
VNTALYWMIWIALVLLCVGEAGRRNLHVGRQEPWAWWAFSAGALLCAIHGVIAMGIRHQWSHEAAIAATARQTMAVYGLNWGGGVYLNYAFVAVWLLDAWWWRRFPSRDEREPRAITWTTRVFFLVMILNAAVVFAGGARRLAGAVIVLWLVWIWRPGRARTPEVISRASD